MVESEIRRTVSVKLQLSGEERSQLKSTIEEYRWAANYILDAAWDGEAERPRMHSRQALHHQTYDSVRSETGLHSAHVQLSRDRAIEALQSVVELRDRGQRAGKPQFTSEFLDFNRKTMTISGDSVSLATLDGRQTAGLCLPDDEATPHYDYLLDSEFEPCRSTVTKRCDDWYLNVGLKRTIDVEPLESSHPGILGIDLGVTNLAVSSTGKFWNGDQIRHWRNLHQRRRRRFQQRGSRAAHENIQNLKIRFQGKIKQALHTVANEIVEEAQDYGCPVIAVEDLTGIYQPGQRWPAIGTWTYRTLVEYVRYKSIPKGIRVAAVDPKNTSKRCSSCGNVDSANRTRQRQFECKDCGYQNHADYNAAKNVGLKYLHQDQTGTDGGAPAGVRVNGGLITEDGYQKFETDKGT